MPLLIELNWLYRIHTIDGYENKEETRNQASFAKPAREKKQ